MPELDPQVAEKLAIALSGDTELYEKVVTHFTLSENEVNEERQRAKEWEEKHNQVSDKNREYTGQIANLVSKLPIGGSARPESYDEKMQAIKERSW